MDWHWISPALGDVGWIALAFVLGLAARLVNLPPLVGFLIAGFLLNALGVTGGDTLEKISEIGVTLLLFTVGLKLEVKTLIRPHVWATSGLHMVAVVVIFGLVVFGLAALNLPLFSGMTWQHAALLAFALSFSSTVFAVKVLEEKAQIKSHFGRVAIGILVIQDLAAVIFLAASAGKTLLYGRSPCWR